MADKTNPENRSPRSRYERVSDEWSSGWEIDAESDDLPADIAQALWSEPACPR
jgi:hypothetical protein